MPITTLHRQPLPPGESVFDLVDTHPEHAVVPDPEQEQLKKQLEKGLKDSFPASDPPAVSQPTAPVREPEPPVDAADIPTVPVEQDDRPLDDDGYPLDRGTGQGSTPGPMSPAHGGPPD
ncbi:MAG: hypothetical protein CTY25_06210 [Methylobacterium sp.]|nr:MAG: hypothetical protein CTY25_06210 [Methylobacterium sp.]